MLDHKMDRVVRQVLLGIMLLTVTPVTLSAFPMTFTYTGQGSGTLAGVPFPMSNFVITATGETANRSSFDQGWRINHTSAYISIDGLGKFDFLSGSGTFVNNSNQSVGFSRGGGDLFNLWQHASLGTWDMLSPIGPLSLAGYLLQWTADENHSFPPVDTTGGVLVFDSRCGNDATFTAVPEPATVSLLALGGFVAVTRWRRRQRI